MSATLTGIVTLLYLGVVASEYRNGNHGTALVFFGYSVANVGFIWSMVK